jgi:aspartate-semialdehyde dehydrogenase
MKSLPSNPIVAVLGATGAVGRVMLQILAERRFPLSELRAIATERSRGRAVPFGDGEIVVETVEDRGFDGVDLVLIDTPDEAARELAPRAADAGAVVVDNSGAWRMEKSVPLVVPEVNAGDILTHEGIIASPNCTTIAMVIPLAALHRTFGIEQVIASSFQSVSGAGQGGVEELREQSVKLADQLDALQAGEANGITPDPRMFPAPVAFNIIPMIGSEKEQGYTGEEWKLLYETRKIMGLPLLPVTGTCVRVPTVVGHGVSVNVRLSTVVKADDALACLRDADGVEVTDLPTVQLSAGKDDCFVGRVRRDPHDPRWILFFSTCDNLRKGAALNAVQIAELLL